MQCIMGLLNLIKMHVMLLEADRNKVFLKDAFFLEMHFNLVLEPEPQYLQLKCWFIYCSWSGCMTYMTMHIQIKSIQY